MREKGISFKEIDHDSARTCEESATFRGESMKIGGKTLLFKDYKGDFFLFALSAAKKLNSNRVRKILKSPKLRFATDEELRNLTSCEKGALPPLGREFLPFDLYLDRSLAENELIAFNAGIPTKSVILKMEDYLTLVDPIWENFTKEDA